jgi:hypothetical protein
LVFDALITNPPHGRRGVLAERKDSPPCSVGGSRAHPQGTRRTILRRQSGISKIADPIDGATLFSTSTSRRHTTV